MTTLDYHALSAAGACIATFKERDLALRFARKNTAQWPGLTVVEVEVLTTRRTIWKQPRSRAESNVTAFRRTA